MLKIRLHPIKQANKVTTSLLVLLFHITFLHRLIFSSLRYHNTKLRYHNTNLRYHNTNLGCHDADQRMTGMCNTCPRIIYNHIPGIGINLQHKYSTTFSLVLYIHRLYCCTYIIHFYSCTYIIFIV